MPRTLKTKVAAGNAHHALGRFGGGLGGRDVDDLCGRTFHSCEKLASGLRGHGCHALHQGSMVASGSPGVARMAPYPWASMSKLRARGLAVDRRLQFDAVIQVEVAHARREGHVHLRPVDVVVDCG